MLRRRFGPRSYVRILEVNGQPAAQFSLGAQDALVMLEVHDGEIAAICTVLNPDRLSYLYRQTGDRRRPRAGSRPRPRATRQAASE
ncbi:MAG TPA: hypothetical protein VHW96_13820 [Solirubrobacteraceae bacterium]|jgi:hypothetical protein|nr:hypothetical protein [Solirubrobacteraceae bacterium]